MSNRVKYRIKRVKGNNTIIAPDYTIEGYGDTLEVGEPIYINCATKPFGHFLISTPIELLMTHLNGKITAVTRTGSVYEIIILEEGENGGDTL